MVEYIVNQHLVQAHKKHEDHNAYQFDYVSETQDDDPFCFTFRNKFHGVTMLKKGSGSSRSDINSLSFLMLP